MKLAMYYPYLYLRGGIERTILESVRHSSHRWTIFTNHYNRAQTFSEFNDLDVRELNRVSVKRSYVTVAGAAARLLFTRLPLHGYSAVLVHTEGLGDLITLRNHRKPVVAYCHTPLKVIYDNALRADYLKEHPFALHYHACARAFAVIDRRAWRHYRHVFCNSSEVRSRILRAALCTSDRIQILHPGVDTNVFCPNGPAESFFLHPTRIKWWKNLQLSIDAFNLYCQRYDPNGSCKLVIAGLVDDYSRAYLDELRMLAARNPRIEFIPNPPDEQLLTLMQRSFAVLNTTLNEDWGIVPLEANACGKPVIAVNCGGVTESQKDGVTGLLVQPNAESFALAMHRLVTDGGLTASMRNAGRQNAARYSWPAFSQAMDTYMESLA